MSDEQDDERDDGADAVAEGMEQLQRAAIDALAAARAMIDAAESVVRQPGAVESLVNSLSEVARTGTETVSSIVASAMKGSGTGAGPRRSADVGDAEDGDEPTVGDDDDDGPDGGFESINLR